MANVRPKDIPTTATTAASDDYMILDGSTNGTRKILSTANFASPSPIGSGTPSTGAFTNLSASGTFALTGDTVQLTEGGTGASDAGTARTNLGLGTVATKAAPSGTSAQLLANDGSGGFANVTVGSGVSYVGGTLSATGSGGTVTSVSVASANGFAGTVADASTTPAITLSTSVTGLLKGNGTAVSAATSGTDYAPATSGTSILKGNGAGGFSSASAGTDYEVPLTFSTGLTRSTNTVTVNTTQSISTLSNLTSNGFVKTSGGTGALSIDTNTYLTTAVTSLAGTANEITASASTGSVTLSIPSAVTFTGKTITGGTFSSGAFNGTVGATTANTGAFTTLSASSTVSGTGFTNYFASPPAIGSTAANTGAFTTASASTSLTTPSVTNAGTLALSATGANIITASTNGSERMRITSAGDVLVNDTTARQSISSVVPILQVTSNDSTYPAAGVFRWSNDAAGTLFGFHKSRGSSTGTQSAVQAGDALGTIGGHGSDGSKFVRGADIQFIAPTTFTSNTGYGAISFRTNNGGDSLTERMRITSAGVLAVGVSDATCAGSAVNGINIGGSSLAAALGLGINSTSDSGTQYFIGFGRNGSVCGQIYSTTTNSTTYATSSDARLKERIETFTDSGRLIDALQPRIWKWKNDGSFGLGFVAQEQHAADPIFEEIGAVLVGDNNAEIEKQWMRSDQPLVPILVAELKSLRARVAALENA